MLCVALPHAHGLGIGSQGEEIIGSAAADFLEFTLGRILHVTPQAKKFCHGGASGAGSASAVGCGQTCQKLKACKQEGGEQIPGKIAEEDPQQAAHQPDPYVFMTPQMKLRGTGLDQPGGGGAERHHHHNQKSQPEARLSQGGSEGDTGKRAGGTGQQAEDQGIAGAVAVVIGEGGGQGCHPLIQQGIVVAGAVDHLFLSEQGAEDPVFQSAALIAHLHALVEHDPVVVIHMDQNIAKLGPGHDHHGQIGTLTGKHAAGLTGGIASGCPGAVHESGRQTPQEHQPVQQGQTCQHIHGNVISVGRPGFHMVGGEYLRGHFDLQGHGFQILQCTGGETGNGLAADGAVQNGFDAALVVAAGEGGLRVGLSGEGYMEAHAVDGIGEAGEQGDLHNGSAQRVDGDTVGQGVAEGQGEVAGEAVDGPGKIHLQSAVCLMGADSRAVQGDAPCFQREGEVGVLQRRFQMKGHGRGYLAGAIGRDGGSDLDPCGTGCGYLDGQRRDQNSRSQNQYRTPHGTPPSVK